MAKKFNKNIEILILVLYNNIEQQSLKLQKTSIKRKEIKFYEDNRKK